MCNVPYQIIMTIKESDKGSVYLASVENHDFPVIVKILKYANRQVYSALMEINNPHLPRVFDAKEIENGLLVIEEYVEGELLSDYLSKQKLAETETVSIAEQLCDALKALHDHRPPLIHRDIKPSNIIINSKGILKLIDFDSSRLYKAESDYDTKLLGTEKYAAPEQYGFSQTDCRSDIYSLGVVLGMFPKLSSKKKEKLWKRIVEKCTFFAPESRYQSIDEVLLKLRKISGVKCKTKILQGVMGVIAGLSALLIGISIWFMPGKNKEDNKEPNKEPISDTDVSLTNELNRTTAPEWRDIPDEPEQYVELKEKIREHQYAITYCFTDRLDDRDFLLQIKELERQGSHLHGIQLESHLTGQCVTIDEKYIEIKDNIIYISNEYMKGLEQGYYSILLNMSCVGKNEPVTHGVYLYISETDEFNDPYDCLQNTTLDFYGEDGETVHLVLNNDSNNKLTKILDAEHNEVDMSLYRILCEGRIVELSNEFLKKYNESEVTSIFAVCQDGNVFDVYLYNKMGNE